MIFWDYFGAFCPIRFALAPCLYTFQTLQAPIFNREKEARAATVYDFQVGEVPFDLNGLGGLVVMDWDISFRNS